MQEQAGTEDKVGQSGVGAPEIPESYMLHPNADPRAVARNRELIIGDETPHSDK